MQSFSPQQKATVSVDVGAASGSVKVSDDGVLQVRVMNNGTSTVWIEFGTTSGNTATVAASIPVGPGVHEVFTPNVRKGPVYAAAIAAGSTGRVYFTPGVGL